MIITELKNKLKKEFGKYYNVILINGPWGIGKTYYLKQELKDKKTLYVSLFGINRLEELKYAIYYELNKTGANFGKFLDNNKNRDIGVSFITLPIPNVSFDINNLINKKFKKGNIILIIDDLERKSDNINLKELLGFIESLSTIEKMKIIVVANEDYINQSGENKDYKDFKEKVISKTYNITSYSIDAVETISKKIIESSSISTIISNEEFYKVVEKILQIHKIKNLRTLEKSILFAKLFLESFNNEIIKDDDKLEIIKICIAIVIEDCDNLYENIKENEQLEERILKYYLNDNYFSGKMGIIKPIINIYYDCDIDSNYKKALDYFVGKYTVTESEKNIFYCSEEEVRKRLNDFYNNNIVNINDNIDINVWFKELNNLYPWTEKINEPNIFKEEEIISAADKYVLKMDVNDSLYNLIDKTIPFHISNTTTKKYYTIIKNKITINYFNKLVIKINESIDKDEYNEKIIEELFDSLGNSYLNDDVIRNDINNIIYENDFFIPNINGDISEQQWHWCHTIWRKCSYSIDYSLKEKLYLTSKKLSREYTTIGKYRIKSLNKQYNIGEEEIDED